MQSGQVFVARNNFEIVGAVKTKKAAANNKKQAVYKSLIKVDAGSVGNRMNIENKQHHIGCYNKKVEQCRMYKTNTHVKSNDGRSEDESGIEKAKIIAVCIQQVQLPKYSQGGYDAKEQEKTLHVPGKVSCKRQAKYQCKNAGYEKPVDQEVGFQLGKNIDVDKIKNQINEDGD